MNKNVLESVRASAGFDLLGDPDKTMLVCDLHPTIVRAIIALERRARPRRVRRGRDRSVRCPTRLRLVKDQRGLQARRNSSMLKRHSLLERWTEMLLD